MILSIERVRTIIGLFFLALANPILAETPSLAVDSKAPDRLSIYISRFEGVGAPSEIAFLTDAVPLLLHTSLLKSRSLVFLDTPPPLGLPTHDTADIVVEGRFLYFRETLRLEATAKRLDTGKIINIHSSVVNEEHIYSAVEELAANLQENLYKLSPDTSSYKLALACFFTNKDHQGTTDSSDSLLESELAFFLASRLPPRSGLSLAPWREVQDLCGEFPDTLQSKLRETGVDALLVGRIDINKDTITVAPELRLFEPSTTIKLPLLSDTMEHYERLEQGLLQDVQNTLDTLLQQGEWKLNKLLPQDTPANVYVENAKALIDTSKDFSLALLLLARATELAPQSADAFVTLGRARLAQGRPTDALESFGKADQLSPNEPVIQAWIGEAYVKQNDLRAAARAFERAVELDAHTAEYRIRLGEVYFLSSDSKSALSQAQDAIKLDPNSSLAYLLIGNVYRSDGNLQEAEAAFKTALAISPSAPLVRASLAEVLLRRTTTALQAGQLSEALAYAQNASSLYPSSNTSALVIQILNRMNRYSDSIKLFKEAEEAGLSSPLLYNSAAYAFLETEHIDESLKLYDQAIHLATEEISTSPFFVAALKLNKVSALLEAKNLRGSEEILSDIDAVSKQNPGWMAMERSSAWIEIGRYDRALPIIHSVLATDPNNPKALDREGFILGRTGRFSEALTSLSRACELDPRNESALSNKAWALSELGRYAEAVGAADSALALRNDLANAKNHKGYSLYQLGQTTEGLALIQEAIQLAPQYAGSHYNLARIYASEKRTKDARRELELALDKDPWYRNIALRDKILGGPNFKSTLKSPETQPKD